MEPGTVLLGHELGVGRKPGEKITVADREFQIERILPEQGSKEDISIVMHLDDAQAVLERPGRVNQIMALGCNCAGSDLPNIRRQLATILPDTRITEFRSIALARAEQRELVAEKHRQILAETAHSREQVQGTLETLAAVTTPVVVLASAIWVGLLALANVRERRTEIGLLRALGKGSSTIASLLLGKAALVGLSGAAVGVLLGIGAAWLLGVEAARRGGRAFRRAVDRDGLRGWWLPLLSAVASYLPTVVALVQDPAIVRRPLNRVRRAWTRGRVAFRRLCQAAAATRGGMPDQMRARITPVNMQPNVNKAGAIEAGEALPNNSTASTDPRPAFCMPTSIVSARMDSGNRQAQPPKYPAR